MSIYINNNSKIESIIRLGILNSQYIDTKRKRIKPEVKKYQICLVIFEIMNKLCEYFECDFIARVTINNAGVVEDKNIDFFGKMPLVKKRRFDEYDNGNDDSNLNFNNKIIYFPIDADNEKSREEKKEEVAEEIELKNKMSNSKIKDKDKIEHNYNKVTPKGQELNYSQIEENVSFSDKKKSPISEKSTSKSSGKSSSNCSNEVLTKLSYFK